MDAEASAAGYIQTLTAIRQTEISALNITDSGTTTRSGLQRSRSGSLGASNHGGVTV